ncbi:MAG: threonine--tRNA ligase [Armatimonadetes bacterium]|nr:threonine--tRNA ligase [Armatimonadota bacterium]
MAEAVQDLFPGTKLAIGPATAEGFYYDFDRTEPFTPEDLERVEARMREIVSGDYPFACKVVGREEALAFFEERGEDYKVELIGATPAEEPLSFYEHDHFIDFCKGPHVARTGDVRAFKLLSVAGAYWRGDEHNKQLQRIYGTAFETQAELEDYLARLEEAKKRDHRRLGRDLDLFSIQEQSGPGLIFWHPKGAMIRKLIEDFWRDEHIKRDYHFAYTPHIASIELWHQSGHTSNYKDSMFSPIEVEGQQYMLKPMNCPFHIQIFRSHLRSYRDLPFRLAELGTVYRYERSGVLHGMLRVRGFTQDDAHIFCTPDQAKAEIIKVIDLVFFMMRAFGYEDFDVELSVRGPSDRAKYLGGDEDWAYAEAVLAEAMEEKGVPYKRMEGEAKFYGPAIDVKLMDSLGRPWQGPTIQFDFNLPQRLDVTYIGDDGKEHYVRMIHRAIIGSMERFVGGLIEHYGGAFPLWLSPVQALILPIADRHHEYAHEVKRRLQAESFRVEVDARNEKTGYKIREAQLQKIPYMLVIGDREVAAGAVAARLRDGSDLGAVPIADLMGRMKEEARIPSSGA